MAHQLSSPETCGIFSDQRSNPSLALAGRFLVPGPPGILLFISINLTIQDPSHKCDYTESACNVGDLGSIPGLGRSPGEGNGNSLRYAYLDSPMDLI